MRLSNSFLASARLISNNCSSPSMVYEAMKRTMDKTLIMLQNRYVVDLFTKLRAKNIGTSEITSLCQRACQKLPKGRANTLRNTLLKWTLFLHQHD